tara:strand:- start:670 stop:1539 length:870 start_codon:yes stop_codon:yes gene_type:complete
MTSFLVLFSLNLKGFGQWRGKIVSLYGLLTTCKINSRLFFRYPFHYAFGCREIDLMIKVKEIVKDGKFPIDPFSWQVRFSINHVKANCEFIKVPWDQTPEILELKNEAPVLIDGERVIKGAFQITKYLERNFTDSPSLFGGSAGLGASRFIDFWAFDVLLEEVYALIMVDLAEENLTIDSTRRSAWENKINSLWGDIKFSELKDLRNERRKYFQDVMLKPLRKTITASTFLGGDSPAFSDYAVAGIFYWARTLSCFEILESGDPVFSWLEEVLNLYSSQFKRPEDAPMA